MIAIAIRALTQNHVSATGGRFGIADDREIVASDIAGEDHAAKRLAFTQLQHDRRATQNVSGFRVHRAHTVGDVEPLPVRHADHLLERTSRVLHAI
jgi:hypothetical protein